MGAVAPCDEETRAQPLAIGSRFDGDQLSLITTDASPLPVAADDNTWTMQLVDAGDQPLVGCSLTVVTDMPDHGHGGPSPAITELGGGEYQLDLRLTMGGFWVAEVAADCGGVTDVVLVTVCAE